MKSINQYQFKKCARSNEKLVNYPNLQSHRGFRGSSNTLENSLASVQAAHDKSYEMVEFDVRLTADNQVVLFHDEHFYLNEKTEKSKKKVSVASSDYEFMNSIRAVDRLIDVFDWYNDLKPTRFILNIEIKSKNLLRFNLEEQVLKLIIKYKMQKNVLISSFNPFTLAYFNVHAPLVFRSLLLSFEKNFNNNVFVKKGVFNFAAEPNALHLRFKDWTSPILKRPRVKTWQHLIDNDIPIVLWTINDSVMAKKFLQQGITGIISDTIVPSEL